MSIQESNEPAGIGTESIEQFASRIGTWLAIAAGIVVGLLVFLTNLDRVLVPLSDDVRSFAVVAFFAIIPISMFTAGFSYYLGIQAWNERVRPNRQRNWRWAIVPVALAYTLFATGIYAVVIMSIEPAFKELEILRIQSALLAGAAAAAFTFWVVTNSMKVDTSQLLILAVVILASGVYLTLLTIDDPQWWRVSFSYLGKLESNVNWIFNSTLIFVGILLLIWRTYFWGDYRIIMRHGLAEERWAHWIYYGLTWIAIALMIVGLFKSQLTPFSSLMHNIAAYSLATVFGVFMLANRWFAPGFPREFHALSWTVVVILIGTITWAIVGGVSTVGLELVVFGLGLMWLSQFAHNTQYLAAANEPDAFPR